MSAEPRWEAVDEPTADLLSLVADVEHPSVEHEWETYVKAVERVAATRFGVVNPNALREAIRGHVAPKRAGAFCNRALAEGLIEWRGEWVVSTDTIGRNAGRPVRKYVLAGGAS